METKTHTRGNVVVQDIKVGDVHYEYEMGLCIKSTVISQPVRDEEGYWTWQSKHDLSDRIIDYGVREGMSHYSSKLYDHEAYHNSKFI